MAATKKGKGDAKAAPSATKSKASAGKSVAKNSKAATNGSNPGGSKSKAAAPKKAAPPKLTDRQVDLLKKIQGAGATGLLPANKNEEKSLDSLAAKKLLKKGKKDKEKGFYAYLLTKTGEKQLTAPAAS
jgi:hypothetical protein